MTRMPAAKIENFNNLADILQCPLCGRALGFTTGSLLCAGGHCYDVAARGYVNFLPNQGPIKGYDAPFFESRRQILAAGFYNGVLEALIVHIPTDRPRLRILDAGCGEGYYASRFAELPGSVVFALDISKEAVKLAAKGPSSVRFLVGDISRLPLQNGVVDCLFNIFTPANYDEFRRVLAPDGLVIKAIPGPRHLQELRHAAQGLIRTEEYGGGQTADHFARHFELVNRQTVSDTRPVTPEQLEQLLRMTPLLFGVNKALVDWRGVTAVTVEAEILLGKAR